MSVLFLYVRKVLCCVIQRYGFYDVRIVLRPFWRGFAFGQVREQGEGSDVREQDME